MAEPDTLDMLDAAWADFEHAHIAGLVEIEMQSRELIVSAIECEERLTGIERRHGERRAAQLPEYVNERRRHAVCVANMNIVLTQNGHYHSPGSFC